MDERRTRIHRQSGLTFDPEATALDPWAYGGHRLAARPRDQLRCPDCCGQDLRGTRQDPARWNNRTDAQLEPDEDAERRRRRRVRMMMITERDLRRVVTQQGILEFTNKLSHSRTSSHPSKGPRAEATMDSGEERDGEGGGWSRRGGALFCGGCRRTYTDPDLSAPPQMEPRWGSAHHTSNDITTGRKGRSVRFKLEGSRSSLDPSGDEGTRGDEGGADRSGTVRPRPPKVRTNRNPLRKTKVHPKRKQEHGHSRGRSKRGGGTGKTGRAKESHREKRSGEEVNSAEDGEEEGGRQRRNPSTPGPEVHEGPPPSEGQTQPGPPNGDPVPSDPQHPPDARTQPPTPASAGSSLSPRGGGLLPSGWSPSLAGEVPGGAGPGTSKDPQPPWPAAGALPAHGLQLTSGCAPPLLAAQPTDLLSTLRSTAPQQSLPPAPGSSPSVEEMSAPPPGPGPQPGGGADQLPPRGLQNTGAVLEGGDGGGADQAGVLPPWGSGGSVQGGGGPVEGDSPHTHAVPAAHTHTPQQQEQLSGGGGSGPKRKLRLVLPEKTSRRPLTALERKIR